MNNIPTIEETKELNKKHDEFYAKARYKSYAPNWNKIKPLAMEELEKIFHLDCEEELIKYAAKELKLQKDTYDGIW